MMSKPAAPGLRRRLIRAGAAAPIALALLAGCAKPKDPVDPTVTGSISQPVTPDDFDKAAAYWGEKHRADVKAKEPALNFASALLRLSRNAQALAVLQATAVYHPQDRDVLSALGRAYAATGDFERALAAIRQAQTPDNPDWRLISAEAAILDQTGRNAEARKLYARALELSPNEASVLSNYGMSYVLTSELKEAERLLRLAIKAPGADSRVRQNLALVVGLQGRFDEAERIAGEDISPAQARANIAYLRQMLSQRNSWEMLRDGANG